VKIIFDQAIPCRCAESYRDDGAEVTRPKYLNCDTHREQEEKYLLDKFLARLDQFAHAARPYVLFTELNTVWRCMDKDAKSILDIGCGEGKPMKFINRHRQFHVTGVDAFEPALDKCRSTGVYNELILGDIQRLHFREYSFDVVICLALIEHLEKEEAEELLGRMEAIARRQVIVTTPVGEYKQGPLEGILTSNINTAGNRLNSRKRATR